MGFFSSLGAVNGADDVEPDVVLTAKLEAHNRAVSLGILEATEIIAKTGIMKNGFWGVEWEGCTIQHDDDGSNSFGRSPTATVAIVKKPDGSVLYHSVGDISNVVVTEVFRFGPWVERFKAKAEAIQLEQKATQEAEERAKLNKKLEPFSEVDF